METSAQTLLSGKTLLLFKSSNQPSGLIEQCRILLDQQMQQWPQLVEGINALKSVQVRDIDCGEYLVKVQWNPQRIVSTSAVTDPNAIRARKCFLCVENLPELQKGILYRDEFLILCNPAPVFNPHFTISAIHHKIQEFSASLDTILEIAKDLHPEFTVFYNGPECGASAPDHLHYQVSPRRSIPVEIDAVDMHRRRRFYYKNHVAGFTLTNYGRTVLVIESSNKDQLAQFIRMMLTIWKGLYAFHVEPKINVLCSYQEEIWRIILFPRSKHRPEVFFKKDADQILTSPAAVDIGGLMVLPRENDFLRMDATLVKSIYEEVTMEQGMVNKILESIL